MSKLLEFLMIFLPGTICATGLWYCLPFGQMGKVASVVAWVLALVLICWALWSEYRVAALVLYGVMLLVMGILWVQIKPSLYRDWAPEVEHTVHGDMDGSRVTLHNIRNFKWRTEQDADPKWDSVSYDLDQIVSVDLFQSYWGIAAIAHTLISFGFEDGRHVAFSFEIRKEKGEAYSNIAGFFKQFEVALIAAEEKDIVYLRTNVRKEDVYRYRIKMEKETMQKLFIAYIKEGNELAKKPKFYNTLTANCTTIVYGMLKKIAPTLKFDPRILASGYLPDYINKVDGFQDVDGMSNEEIKKAAAITKKAKDAVQDDQYSTLIRQ